MNSIQPNVVIIRIPDVDGSKTFLQIPIEGTKVLFPDCQEFQVLDGDDYNQLSFSDIVLGLLSDGGDSSIELARVEIMTRDGSPAILNSDPIELAMLISNLIDEWNNLPDQVDD